jgi:hypothetical protein
MRRDLRIAAAAWALLVNLGACAPSLDGPGYPLYPPTPGGRLPRAEVARLYGPIAAVDGRDVSALGDVYEVMPGCHTVLTRSDSVDSTTYVAVTGGTGKQRLVVPMRAGYAYFVKRVAPDAVVTSMQSMRVETYAEEYDPSGSRTSVIRPAQGAAPDACKDAPAP